MGRWAEEEQRLQPEPHKHLRIPVDLAGQVCGLGNGQLGEDVVERGAEELGVVGGKRRAEGG